MHILYLTAGAEIGGGSRSLLTMIRGLKAYGAKATVVCPCNGSLVSACIEAGADCHVRTCDWLDRSRPWRTWKGYRSWVRFLKTVSPDLIHVNAMPAARAVAWPARTARIPWTCHCRFAQSPKLVRWLFHRRPKPNLFLFNSNNLQSQVGQACAEICPHVPQRVLHNALNLDEFQPRTKPPGDPLRVGIVANLAEFKGHDTFIEMAHLLTQRGIEAEFWIVGRDKGAGTSLKHQVNSVGLNRQVRFLGYQSDMPAVIGNLDVVVCTSRSEAFGRCLIEAMACQRPVVASAVGGIPEVVDDNVTGFLVPPRDPRAFADAAERLLKDAELRRKMGRAGAERVKRLFDSQSHMQQLMEIYDNLLQKAGREPAQTESTISESKSP